MKNCIFILTAILVSFASTAHSIEPLPGYYTHDNTNVIKKRLLEESRRYCATDTTGVWHQNTSIKLSGANHHAVFFNREMLVECIGKKKFLLQCAYRAKNLKGRLDVNAVLLGEKGNMLTQTYFPAIPVNSEDWQLASGEFYCSASKAKLKVSVKLSGTGQAWIDDILVKEIQ